MRSELEDAANKTHLDYVKLQGALELAQKSGIDAMAIDKGIAAMREAKARGKKKDGPTGASTEVGVGGGSAPARGQVAPVLKV